MDVTTNPISLPLLQLFKSSGQIIKVNVLAPSGATPYGVARIREGIIGDRRKVWEGIRVETCRGRGLTVGLFFRILPKPIIK